MHLSYLIVSFAVFFVSSVFFPQESTSTLSWTNLSQNNKVVIVEAHDDDLMLIFDVQSDEQERIDFRKSESAGSSNTNSSELSLTGYTAFLTTNVASPVVPEHDVIWQQKTTSL